MKNLNNIISNTNDEINDNKYTENISDNEIEKNNNKNNKYDNYNTNSYKKPKINKPNKYIMNKKEIDNEDKYSTNNNKNNIKNDELFSKDDKEDALYSLNNILTKRGLRGILYLYSQFLSFCPNINKITFNDFVLVFKIQHINLDIKDIKKIFELYSKKNNNKEEPYWDFYSFIRTYKKELNENKLNSVEQAFSIIDEKGEDKVPLDVIKTKYNAKKHPDVLNGKYTEDGKVMEFLDCFSLCYNILKIDNKDNRDENGDYVDFEVFANFYEYVSFIYPRDRDFQYVVNATWI